MFHLLASYPKFGPGYDFCYQSAKIDGIEISRPVSKMSGFLIFVCREEV
jgi:hypothetical protein